MRKMSRSTLNPLETEQQFLATIIQDPLLLDLLERCPIPNEFSSDLLAWTFETIIQLRTQNRIVSISSIMEEMRTENQTIFDSCGGMELFNALTNFTPRTYSLASEARTIVKKHELREIVTLFNDAAKEAGKTSVEEVDSFRDQIEQRLFSLRTTEKKENSWRQDLKEWMSEFQLRVAGKKVGESTGLGDYDAILRMTPGLHVLAARPGMGKTALAMQILMNVARRKEGLCLFFSYEMGRFELIDRCLANAAKIPLDKLTINADSVEPDEISRLMEATSEILEYPLQIIEPTNRSVGDLCASARRKASQKRLPISMIVVDYLQIMSFKGDDVNRGYGEITTALHNLYKELACPILLLSQINRACTKSADKRPKASQLRDSGAIESDADSVTLLYRDEVYHDDSDEKGIAELIVDKNRSGSIGKAKVRFIGKYLRFESL